MNIRKARIVRISEELEKLLDEERAKQSKLMGKISKVQASRILANKLRGLK